MHALGALSLNADSSFAVLQRERATRTLLHALAAFASGLLKAHRLSEVNSSRLEPSSKLPSKLP